MALVALRVISGFIWLFNVAEEGIPPKQHSLMDSTVRLGVVFKGDEGQAGLLRDAAGDVPLVHAFNDNQYHCGSSGEDFLEFITPGLFANIAVKQKEGPGEQATSLQIIPTTNALCIASIAQTWADGTHRGWGNRKGLSQRSTRQPACTWVDNDDSHAIATPALQINMQGFTKITKDYNKDPNFHCQHPTMFFKPHAKDYKWNDKHYTKPKEITFWDDTDLSSSPPTISKTTTKHLSPPNATSSAPPT